MILDSVFPAIASARSAIITGVVCAGVCLPLGYCRGYDAAKDKARAELAIANVAVQNQDKTASDAAATERVTDAIAQAKQQTELSDAVAAIPDSVPDASRVALGCARLRANGRAETSLPAACGYRGGVGSEAATD